MIQERAESIRRVRERLNTLSIAAGGILWLLPLSIYWLELLGRGPDARNRPRWSTVGACAVVTLLPLALPRGYFRVLAFETRRLYERLGVRLFRRFAPDGDLINRRLRRIDSTYRAVQNREMLAEHIRTTYAGERGHLVCFLAGCFTGVFAIRSGRFVLGSVLAFGNLLFNLYPILLHRYNRARIQRSER